MLLYRAVVVRQRWADCTADGCHDLLVTIGQRYTAAAQIWAIQITSLAYVRPSEKEEQWACWQSCSFLWRLVVLLALLVDLWPMVQLRRR